MTPWRLGGNALRGVSRRPGTRTRHEHVRASCTHDGRTRKHPQRVCACACKNTHRTAGRRAVRRGTVRRRCASQRARAWRNTSTYAQRSDSEKGRCSDGDVALLARTSSVGASTNLTEVVLSFACSRHACQQHERRSDAAADVAQLVWPHKRLRISSAAGTLQACNFYSPNSVDTRMLPL